MRSLIWPLLATLPLLTSCASDDTAEIDGGEVVYVEGDSGTLAAHNNSSVAYGADGTVGSAGPGGDGGAGVAAGQGATYNNAPVTTSAGTAVPATAVVVESQYVWYKPWTWRHRAGPARPMFRPARPAAPVVPRPVVVPSPVVPVPRPVYVAPPAPVYVAPPRPVVPAPRVVVPVPRPYVPAPRVYVPRP